VACSNGHSLRCLKYNTSWYIICAQSYVQVSKLVCKNFSSCGESRQQAVQNIRASKFCGCNF
jgi:hypothetical protein